MEGKKGKAGDKIAWKLVETEVRKKYPKIKVVYSRAEEASGELAISSHKLKPETIDSLIETKIKVGEDEYSFSKLEGEVLKEFW